MSMTGLLLVLTAVIMPQSLKHWSATPSARVAAERSILRLPPAAFPELPASVQQVLERDGCRIPRREEGEALQVIVRGTFARPGQTDWAVLCSRQNRSVIRVVWGGPSSCPGSLATMEESRLLRPLASGEFEFARQLDIARADSSFRGDVGPESDQGPDGGPATTRLDSLIDRAGADVLGTYRCTNGEWTSEIE
jgi:hypothetical protein